MTSRPSASGDGLIDGSAVSAYWGLGSADPDPDVTQCEAAQSTPVEQSHDEQSEPPPKQEKETPHHLFGKHEFRAAARVVAMQTHIHVGVKHGAAAMRSAVLIGNHKQVNAMLHNVGGRSSLLYRDFAEWQIIHTAANQGRAGLVTELCKAGADVNSRTALGHTPLLLAAQHGHRNTLEVLLKNGAQASVVDGHGNMPVHAAAAVAPLSKTLSCVSTLLRHEHVGSVPLDGHGQSLLAIAAARGDAALAALLLDQGALTSGPHFATQGAQTFESLAAAHPGFLEAVEEQRRPPSPSPRPCTASSLRTKSAKKKKGRKSTAGPRNGKKKSLTPERGAEEGQRKGKSGLKKRRGSPKAQGRKPKQSKVSFSSSTPPLAA